MNTQALADALNKLNNSTKYTTAAVKALSHALDPHKFDRKSSPLLARHRQRRHHR